MHLLRVTNLTRLHETVNRELLFHLKELVGVKFKYLNNSFTIIEVDYLDLIVVELETKNKVKFKEFLTLEDFKFYADNLERV